MNYLRFVILLLSGLFIINTHAQKQENLPAEKDMAAYLMVYFKDDTHGLYFYVHLICHWIVLDSLVKCDQRIHPKLVILLLALDL